MHEKRLRLGKDRGKQVRSAAGQAAKSCCEARISALKLRESRRTAAAWIMQEAEFAEENRVKGRRPNANELGDIRPHEYQP